MSEHEGDAAPVENGEAEEVAAPVVERVLDPQSALREVLKQALRHGGVVRGLRECAKALDRREARICVLASSCDEQGYINLVHALCKSHNILLMKVPDGKKLGEWAGLCKLDKDAKPRKVVGCSCVVIKEFGKQTEELSYLLDHLKSNQ
eukprot:CAMPEP_0119138564 /NCGR_PEP_ID=MMETSP1310-20130426/25886_1 /TAXON_ID=464262 /ORGANISM="Genus nov. species nov., Strain RCC2339" /LENGTH=148 /DNA_ID=CAMNT_0007129767 /DNA_START=94 /DNA_END=540 /DNA_ORIENTATION=-